MGSAIFLAAAFVPRSVPHPSLVLMIWTVGGLISVAGALTYAELGTMYPEAGGQYQYLKQAFGPLPSFLFGWISILAIQSGGAAYLGVAFGEYLGVFIPFFSSKNVLASVAIGPWLWQPTTAQLAGVTAVGVLSAVNYFGAKEGARTQTIFTIIKVASLVGLIAIGLAAPAKASPDWTAPLPSGNLLPGIVLAMVAVFGSFDGWYQATLSAGEIRRPERNLPLGMVGGTLVILVLYVLVNWVYLRALPIADIGASSRIGEDAAAALLGPRAGRLLAGAVLISVVGCIASTLLGASRIGLPMAQDGVFFKQLATIHPRHLTPTVSIVTLGIWSSILTLSGSYEQLFTYATLSALMFHVATGAAVFRLRRTEPDTPRPYRAWGYPWVPAIFVLGTLGVILVTMVQQPRESLLGVGLVILGVPAFLWMRRSQRSDP
jgi:APA family basic amino acid/polyamine antiporter